MKLKREKLGLQDSLASSSTQTRFGEAVRVTEFEAIYNCGLLKDIASLYTTRNKIYFEGFETKDDIGKGIFYRDDTLTEEPDGGVILNIKGILYKRQYQGNVYLDWFGIDFFSALQRAVKYKSVNFTNDKVYTLTYKDTIHIANDVTLNMNNATIRAEFKAEYAIALSIASEVNLSIIGGNFETPNIAKVFRIHNIGRLKYYDLLTLNNYTPATAAPVTSKIADVNSPIDILATKTFTNEVIVDGDNSRADDLITREYLKKLNISNNVLINEDAIITGIKTFAESSALVAGAPEVNTKGYAISSNYLDKLVDSIFDPEFKSLLDKGISASNPIIPVGGYYIQYAHGDAFLTEEQPNKLWGLTNWEEVTIAPDSAGVIHPTLLALTYTPKTESPLEIKSSVALKATGLKLQPSLGETRKLLRKTSNLITPTYIPIKVWKRLEDYDVSKFSVTPTSFSLAKGLTQKVTIILPEITGVEISVVVAPDRPGIVEWLEETSEVKAVASGDVTIGFSLLLNSIVATTIEVAVSVVQGTYTIPRGSDYIEGGLFGQSGVINYFILKNNSKVDKHYKVSIPKSGEGRGPQHICYYIGATQDFIPGEDPIDYLQWQIDPSQYDSSIIIPKIVLGVHPDKLWLSGKYRDNYDVDNYSKDYSVDIIVPKGKSLLLAFALQSSFDRYIKRHGSTSDTVGFDAIKPDLANKNGVPTYSGWWPNQVVVEQMLEGGQESNYLTVISGGYAYIELDFVDGIYRPEGVITEAKTNDPVELAIDTLEGVSYTPIASITPFYGVGIPNYYIHVGKDPNYMHYDDEDYRYNITQWLPISCMKVSKA